MLRSRNEQLLVLRLAVGTCLLRNGVLFWHEHWKHHLSLISAYLQIFSNFLQSFISTSTSTALGEDSLWDENLENSFFSSTHPFQTGRVSSISGRWSLAKTDFLNLPIKNARRVSDFPFIGHCNRRLFRRIPQEFINNVSNGFRLALFLE